MRTTGTEQITFAEALWTTQSRRRHLLLGNGFSLGVHENFGYPSLFKEAVNRDPSLALLFAAGETNFEVALRACSDTRNAMRLRAGLILAVAKVHPYYSLSLTEEQCRSCRHFLEYFVGRDRSPRGSVFTTNYDLLLHWVISRQGKTHGTKQRTQLKCWDGFDSRGDWNPNADAEAYYLHGAVHIYQHTNARTNAVYTKMIRYERGRPLTRQVDNLLSANHFPVFVAEGTAPEKRATQRRWEYLKRANAKFRTVCREQGSVRFTVGHRSGDSDDHIAAHIADGTVDTVFMGTFADTDRARAEELAVAWAATRRSAGGPAVEVRCFPVRECCIWDRKVSAEAASPEVDPIWVT